MHDSFHAFSFSISHYFMSTFSGQKNICVAYTFVLLNIFA